MTTTTHDFTATWKQSQWAYHVEVETGVELPESVKGDRWYKVLAPFITKVERWAVQSDIGGYAHDWVELAKLGRSDRTYVIHTAFGTACVVLFRDHSAIQGITMNGVRKAKAFTLDTWRKYGTKRGHGMGYLRAAHGMGLCSSPESGRNICEFEAICRLTQGGYAGEPHYAATRGLYASVEA